MASIMKDFAAITASFFLILITTTSAIVPKAIVLKVARDPLTGQHTAVFHQRTPLVAVKLSLDLGGDSVWMDCATDYNSSSYRSLNCNEDPRCKLLRPLGCDKESCFDETEPWYCNSRACVTLAYDPFNTTWDENYPEFINWYEGGEAAEDVLSLRYTTSEVALAKQFLFTCTPDMYFFQDFPTGVRGVAGLGPTDGAIPTQLSRTFGLARKFMVCLSPSSKAKGAVVFGDFPVSSFKLLLSTPLLRTPAQDFKFYVMRLLSEYYIGVKSIKVNGKNVPVDSTLLSFNDRGAGGTIISTADPYTVLKSSIYKAVVDAFIGELPAGMDRFSSPAGSPFATCFSGGVTVAFPSLSLVLGDAAEWEISGEDLMVPVGEGVMCLGLIENRRLFQDGAAIMIGAKQLENHLLEFDLSTSTLSVRKTSCAKFSSTATGKT